MKSWVVCSLLFGFALGASAEVGEANPAADAARERDRARAAAGERAADEARARHRREMEVDSKSNMASDFRRALGKDAQNLSDDEVIRLYREKEMAGAVAR